MEGEQSLDEFENRVLNKCELQNSEFKATMCNIQAYIKHHRGQNEAALECLQQAEELIQRQHAGQAEIRSLVTWGNYAWVYYHMGRLSEAQIYVDKVKEVCAKCSSPYRIESPELDCEEGWTRLKCTKRQNERGKVCFEKALEKDPKNPEFFTGWAIENYRLDRWPASQNPIDALRTAIELNPDNQYMKVLLALKLQKLNEEDEESEGDRLVEEALREAEGATDVLCSAAKFYRNKRAVDKSIDLLREALKSMPDNAYLHYHIGCCYRSKVQRMLSMRDRGMNGKSEFLELTQQAVHHLKRADEINGNLLNACSHPAGIFSYGRSI
jgi:tetratricopeptide (TPR) repeat protein